MNVWSYLSFALALLVAAAAGSLFFARTKPRVLRLRSVVGRICVQLSPDQRATLPDTRFDPVKHLLRADTDTLTAVEFLDDLDRNKSFLDRVGAVSPSLFIGPVTRMVGLGHLLALFICPLFLAGLFSLLAEPDLIHSKLGLAILVGVAAAGGVLFSLLFSILVWRFFFEQDVAATMEVVEQQPLWSSGPTRRPQDRTIVLPKDDPGYSGLRR